MNNIMTNQTVRQKISVTQSKIQKWFVTGLCAGLSGFFVSTAIAAPQALCVFDITGANGMTMSMAKDYVLQAKQWGVDFEPKVYIKLGEAIRDFDNHKCAGLVADNFVTRKYNVFAGSIGAVGAVPDYTIAQKILMALASPQLAGRMKNNQYEIVGVMPYGLVYLMAKDKSINSLERTKGHTIGVLADDPSQQRMAQKVGMIPKIMAFDTAASQFRNDEFDIVPAPLIVWEAYEGEKLVGANGGVADYPMALMTMNMVLHNGATPVGFGQKSREWFAKQSPQFLKIVQQWDAKVPSKYWVRIPEMDRPAYDHLVSQLRKEFIDNGVYDKSMITLIRTLRCKQDPKFIECRQ